MGGRKNENAQTRTASVLKKTDYFAATPKIFGHMSQELADQALKRGKTLIIKNKEFYSFKFSPKYIK